MKLFPKQEPPVTTPEIIKRCRKGSRVFLVATLAWLAVWLLLLFVVHVGDVGIGAVMVPALFALTMSDQLSRMAGLHERVIDLQNANEALAQKVNQQADAEEI